MAQLKFSAKFPACQGRVYGSWGISRGRKIAVDLFSIRKTDKVEAMAVLRQI